MVAVPFSIQEDYWENFDLQDEDIEFLYNVLLEREIPLTTRELIAALVEERIRREKQNLERQRQASGDYFQPKNLYSPGQKLIFPALNWLGGEVLAIRPGHNPEIGDFQVIQVALSNRETREFASGLPQHILNEPIKLPQEDASMDLSQVLGTYAEDLEERLEEGLSGNRDFVRIAGRWFPRALLIDINVGHLNLAEAVLDMAGGGPLPTAALIEQIDLPSDMNPKLVDFSLDLALQEDGRFDEVGPAGDVQWFLHRLEPQNVLETPVYLRYPGIEYDRALLTKDMLALEQELDDELSPLSARHAHQDEVEVTLIFPHWRSGTLPLSASVRHLFPTAYEAPRIRFILVDGESGEKFSGWVVREKRYVYGFKEWYETHNIIPGSTIKIGRGKRPGEVIVRVDRRRPSREWIRTVLVGSDGGVVYAMLKQVIQTPFDDRMAIMVPDPEALDGTWTRYPGESLERVVVNTIKEIAKLNPQGHVHATELYAAVNVVRRCPPAPLLGLLAGRPGFVHVGDLHYRLSDY